MLLSHFAFAWNLICLDAWDLLHNGSGFLLAQLGTQLRDLYDREQLYKQLGTYQPPMIKGHTQRQDFSLPLPPRCDWSQQAQEEVYIHFLRLVAYAIDEQYQRVVEECVRPFNHDKSTFRHGDIHSIKGFPRMLNKMLTAEDHRYEAKPRPGLCVSE